jgi:GAF domain-containing protein
MTVQSRIDWRPDKDAAEAPERETYIRAAADVLGRLANVTWSPTDLTAVLEGLAEVAMDATAADRVSFFLFDDDATSVRLSGVRGAANLDLWQLGASLPPISMEEFPRLAEVLRGTETLRLEDVSASPLIPSEWVELFDLTSLLIAPLRVGETALGALVVDYRSPRALPDDLVRLAGTLARLSALAISNALLATALAEQATRLETLVEGTRALRAPRTLAEATDDVGRLIARVLDAELVAIYLFEEDGEQYRVLAQLGATVPESGPMRDLPKRVLARVRSAWRRGGPHPVALAGSEGLLPPGGVLQCEVRGSLVLPLTTAGGEVFGFIVVGSNHLETPTAVTLGVASTLAAHVALAVERAQLDERVALAAEFACALLSLDGLGDASHEGLLATLHEVVTPAVGFELTGIRLASEDRPRRGLAQEDERDRRVWARWRYRRTRPEVHEDGGVAYAPIWSSGRLLGMLRVRPIHGQLERHEQDLLEGLAAAIGERLVTQELQESSDRQARELAVVEERSRVAAELHATVGGLLTSIGSSADALRHELPAGPLATEAERLGRLAWAGRVGLQQTAASLEAYVYHPSGLPATLQGIVERLAEVLDVAADLEVRGLVRAVPLEVERALVRTMHEALARVEARGRASAVAVRLEYLPDAITLEVRDDGVPLGAREGDSVLPSAHFGLRVMQRRLLELGGNLQIDRPPPRGLMLKATVPT